MLVSMAFVPASADAVFAANMPESITATFTAQADGNFLCAPQIGATVKGDTAENYGFSDSVTDGVSVLDALVNLHEIKYDSDFTRETAPSYLAMSEDGYISRLFGVDTTANGFVYNGAYPNDGTESEWGGYNGTTVTTQKLSDNDTVEFFLYQDSVAWSDEIAWFNYKGSPVTAVTAVPKASIKLNLRTSSYMMAYQYIDAAAIHAVGSSVSGAQLAWVDTETGAIEDISSAITDTSGNVIIAAPETEGKYYLTAYIPESEQGEPLIMSLTEITVTKDAAQADPCALSSLSVASFESNPNALALTPAFDKNIREYTAETVDYPAVDLDVFRSVYVKAAAETDEAVITAECNGISADISSGDSMWKMLSGALIGGKDNQLNITVAASGDEAAEKKTYSVKIPMKSKTKAEPVILAAEATTGEWYPAFSSDVYSYWLVTENTEETPILTYKVADGNTVKIGTEEQTADVSGKYTLALSETQTSIIVTSEDGNFSNTYKFGYKKKSALDVPDKIVDYLCIGSQYTNRGYGINPEETLSGGVKSLGNFGGYITYYYETPIKDNPNNKYGMDFYVIGNPSAETDSFAEPGQVYVSEDGSSWYALAGSDHYEDSAIWDYTITYTKGDDGKAYWTDNYSNSIDYAAREWPGKEYYYMNNAAEKDSYTFTGVLLKSQLGSITGDSSSAASVAARPKFGYTDCYKSNLSGDTLSDVNSYAENPSKANGFDIAWAVDENGEPIDVSEKEFHYIKIATASNINAGITGEKSTEVTYVVRTAPQEETVGKTNAPSGVTISDGADSKIISFTEEQNVYPVNLGSMKYVSIRVNGTDTDDNIYINNQRVASGEAADGFKVTKEKGETKVRVIVQNGDKEPVIYLLKLTSGAEESKELVEGIKIDAGGTVREASTKNGTDYTVSVGYRIGSISIAPVAAGNVKIKVNGEEPADFYNLAYGSNTFEIVAEGEDGNKQTAILTVTRDNPPVSTGKTITVKFTLYGDEKHGGSETHTYKNNKSKLPTWISGRSYAVNSGATVLDVVEKALAEANISWKNDGGNYISEINGLAEFDNGALSGWMYILNGAYSELGAAEQTLKNGDIIVVHYTDDYTQEENPEKQSSSSSGIGSAPSYTVRFETDGGSTIGSQSVAKNALVTKPADPAKDGYEFAGWYTNKDLTDEYDFSKKVTSSFILYAKWTKTNIISEFTDIEKGAWYEEAVCYATEKNLLSGVSKTEFAPDREMTRAMLVTVLFRIEKPEEKERTHYFADVADGEWYAEAVNWAAESGIVNGVSETEFAPNDNITREQLAVFLYRYAKLKGCDTEEFSELSGYADADQISEYALNAVKWANAAGLITGTSETSISPKSTATRAQAAAILMRLYKNVLK